MPAIKKHSMLGRSFILLFALFSINGVLGQAPDWRNIRNGLIIPDESYSDQPYIVKTDDRAWLCILTTGSGREGQSGQYVAVTRSADQGKTLSEARRLPEGFMGPIKNKPVQLTNGDILCPTSSEEKGWRVHFERTPDNAETWSKTDALNDGRKIGAIQPSVLFLGGDKLLALGRTRQKKIFQITSEDSGKTWGKMTLTDLPNPSAGTDAVTLKDGRHLLVYNHTSRGRSPLNLAVSHDGHTWQAASSASRECRNWASWRKASAPLIAFGSCRDPRHSRLPCA